MADDLQRRVPVIGMADCQIGKGEVPLRIRLKRQEEEEKENRWVSLKSLWEEGERQREQDKLREGETETEMERMVREGDAVNEESRCS